MWENINSEDEFEARLSEHLAAELEDRGLLSEMELDRGRKIAKDAAFTRSSSGETEFRIYFSETDIVLFERSGGDDPVNPSSVITDELAGASGVVLDQLNLDREASDRFRSHSTLGEILVPRYILELKLEGTITHDYLTYSRKASQFKQMFHGVEIAMVILDRDDNWEKIQRNLPAIDNIFALGDDQTVEEKEEGFTHSVEDVADWIEFKERMCPPR